MVWLIMLACSVGRLCPVWAGLRRWGYAANTPSRPIAPIPEIGWPSNEKNPRLIRAIGQHPKIIVLTRADAKGAPSAGRDQQSPSPESPAGCYAVAFYPRPSVRPDSRRNPGVGLRHPFKCRRQHSFLTRIPRRPPCQCAILPQSRPPNPPRRHPKETFREEPIPLSLLRLPLPPRCPGRRSLSAG